LERSAKTFGLAFDAALARAALKEAVRGKSGRLRVRLVLNETGDHQAEAIALAPNPPHWSYAVSVERVVSSDVLLCHKTSWRDLYEREAARHPGDEVIFRNERGELTEGARSNIFVKRKDKLLTPPLCCGLLPGILRGELLESGRCEEAILTESDLAGEVLLGNSLRGLIAARPL
jgi:branched-subunit amino acid aminotransferase/4-amino-4-deoxychorismate lyase